MKNINRWFILTFILALTKCCHYSCLACTGPEYISCINCSANGKFTVVQNISETPAIYLSSNYNTGTCVPTLPSAANALGIVVFILVGAIALFFRTKQSFYLLFTLQTYGLYSLLELAWVNPIGYVLQGLQHFMIFNTMGFNYKTENYALVVSKNHRLDSFLGTTNVGQNLAIIAPFTLVGLVILIVIAIISLRKKKQKEQLKNNQGNEQPLQNQKQGQAQLNQTDQNKPQEKQCCEKWRVFSEQVLIKIAKFVLCILFLLVQQTMVVLLVTLVYQPPVSRAIIALCVIYIHILPLVMSYCFYYRIQYFSEKKIMYLTFAHKIILPVMVVVPIKYQYVFFIFAIFFVILEFVFDRMNGLYQSFNRLAVYKVCEAICVLVLTVYYIVQQAARSYPSSQAAAISATFFLAFNLFLFFGVELPLSIKQKYFSKKGEQTKLEQKEMVQLLRNDTLNGLDQKEHHVEAVDLYNNGNDSSDQDQTKNNKDQPTHDGNSIVASLPASLPTSMPRQTVAIQVIKVQNNSISNEKQKVDPEPKKDIADTSNNHKEVYSINVNSFPAANNSGDNNFKATNGFTSTENKAKASNLEEEKEKNEVNGENESLQNRGHPRATVEKPAEQQKPPQPSPPPKKKRRQIIDPQLRMRYGI